MMGIPSIGTVPSMPTRAIDGLRHENRYLPGWYIIDQETMLRQDGDYAYLRLLNSGESIGYSFQAFHITETIAESLQQQFNNMEVRPQPSTSER